MKVCFKCHVEKRLDEFYAHPAMGDGHLGKCKECTKFDAKARYKSKRDEILAYDRMRNDEEPRRLMKRAYSLAYSKRNADKRAETQRKSRLNNLQKYKARTMVGNYIRDGKLKREPCETCGSTLAQAHHEDYSKPLEVRWLCSRHHGLAHRKHK